MVKVAICDDEKDICTQLEVDLIDIFSKLKAKYEIDIFFAGHELCKKIQTGTYYDLIFLDIEFANSEINGVRVGQLIREDYNNNIVSIVYISWENNYAMQLFEIRPLNFITKPLTHDKIEQTIQTYLKISSLSSGEFVYKKNHGNFRQKLKDIIYLESRGRKVVIHLVDSKEEEFYGSLKDVYNEQLINFDFLFIHASFVVNYDYVSETKYSQLFLTNIEKPLPISQNRRNEIKQRYVEIMRQRG